LSSFQFKFLYYNIITGLEVSVKVWLDIGRPLRYNKLGKDVRTMELIIQRANKRIIAGERSASSYLRKAQARLTCFRAR